MNCNNYNQTYILTSLSEVPHRVHDLHSMHCHRYFFTLFVSLTVNCKQVGCPVKYKVVFSIKIKVKCISMKCM